MNRHFRLRLKHIIKNIFILIIILIFLFSKKVVFANLKDDYPGEDIQNCSWHITWFGNTSLASGVKIEDCTYNEQNGWYEYQYNGTSYVVLAAAHRELIGNEDNETTGQGKYREWIHYFEYYDTIQFKLDGQIYGGIILDGCGAAMRVNEGDTQIINVLACEDINTYNGNMKEYDGTEIEVTETGVFSSEAGTSSSSAKRNLIIDMLSALFYLIGDIANMLVNTTFTLTYTKSEIESNSQLNSEIQVGDYNNGITENTFKAKNIANKADNEKGQEQIIFSKSTEIPVIPIDLYKASINTIKILDINFFDTSNSNTDKLWNFIKNIVITVSHYTLYISAILILTMIILRSILLVKDSLGDSPEGAAKSRKIIDNLVKTIILIVGIYVVITIMIYGYHYVLELILEGNTSNYLIRANVEDVYSFNTNILGYFKYMTLQSNSEGALLYSIVYGVVSVISCLWYVFMFIRVIAIGLLIIIAPLTAINFMSERVPKKGFSLTNVLYFTKWIKLYSFFIWIPLVVVIVYRLILYI